MIREGKVEGAGFDLPITLEKRGEVYSVKIDGVTWVETESGHHAVIMYELLRKHVTEYMTYIKKGLNDQ